MRYEQLIEAKLYYLSTALEWDYGWNSLLF